MKENIKRTVYYNMIDCQVVIIDGNEHLIRGVETKSPFFIDYSKMVQPEILDKLAKILAYTLPKETTMVSGFNFSNIIAYEIAKVSNKKFLPLKNGVMNLSKGNSSEVITHIPDVIITGDSTAEAISLIKIAGYKNINVFPVFDYGFNLQNRGCRNIIISPMLTIKDLVEFGDKKDPNTQIIKNWVEKNQIRFGNKNRYVPAEVGVFY